jgi:hypothetical protein
MSIWIRLKWLVSFTFTIIDIWYHVH